MSRYNNDVTMKSYSPPRYNAAGSPQYEASGGYQPSVRRPSPPRTTSTTGGGYGAGGSYGSSGASTTTNNTNSSKEILSPWRYTRNAGAPSVASPVANMTSSNTTLLSASNRRSPSPTTQVNTASVISNAAQRLGYASSVAQRESTQQREEYELKVLGALLKTCQFRYVEVGKSTRETGKPYLYVTERAKPHRIIFIDTRYHSYTIRDIVVEEMKKNLSREKEVNPAGGIIVVTPKAQITTAARDRLLTENMLFVKDEKNLAFSLGRAIDAIFDGHGHGTTVHALGLFGGEGEVNLSAMEENRKRSMVLEARGGGGW